MNDIYPKKIIEQNGLRPKLGLKSVSNIFGGNSAALDPSSSKR